MKKLSIVIFAVIVSLLTSFSAVYAASYFSNNKALDAIFAKLQKVFLQYEKNETIPLKEYQLVVTEEDKKNVKPLAKKKISDQQVKAAAEKRLNDLRAAIEIKEEELGGLTQQDYKIISDHMTDKIFFARGSEFGWDYDGKIVSLYFNLAGDDKWVDFKGLSGNFAAMGKEKDQTDPAALLIRSKIVRYLNQSIQKGNKVSPEILETLPGELEKLFVDNNLSRIVAGRLLARIHSDIYTPEAYLFDGSQSVEELMESYEAAMELIRDDREDEQKVEYYEYPADMPSGSDAQKYIAGMIVDGKLSEPFTSGFSKTITLDELARLYFGSKNLDEKIVIEDGILPADSPDYVKKAFIYGMLDDGSNLDKPLTRLEAARRLVNSVVYYMGMTNSLRVTDCAKVPIADQNIVASCLHGGMNARKDKFEPQANYTKEEAILDYDSYGFSNLRGYNIPLGLSDPTKIIVGKNTIQVLFNNKDEIKKYMNDYFSDTALSDIKLTGSYMRIDTGCALIELFTPENGIKFTIKNGVQFIDFDEGKYGPGLTYNIEPKVLKSNEKVDMNMQLDSIYKKLYAKLDVILAKIIKPGMTQEQKVKAIHDYVVTHVTYDIKLMDEQTLESVLTTIDVGRGVCGDYSLLFMHLCKRASIPCVFEAGTLLTINHAWNAVFLNGEWKFVDTTWDDKDNGKVLYTYYLKDRFTFMKDHTPFMGTPDEDVYPAVDRMNIKTQDDLRVFLMNNFFWIDGFQLTFRMADKNMKPFIGYLWTSANIKKIELTYDSKNNLYTVSAKGKK